MKNEKDMPVFVTYKPRVGSRLKVKGSPVEGLVVTSWKASTATDVDGKVTKGYLACVRYAGPPLPIPAKEIRRLLRD
jgi:hypothetical protein